MGEPHRLGKLTSVDDPHPAAWLSERTRAPHRHDVRVDTIVPAGFAAYARIFHPAYRQEPPLIVDGTRTPLEKIAYLEVTWAEIARANHRVLHPEAQFESLIGYVYDLHRHTQPGLWTTPPQVGTLPERQVASLAAALAPYTTTPDRCWFAVWEGWGSQTHRSPQGPTVHLPYRNYYLYTGPLDAARQSVVESVGHQTASLWWPDDHAWCVGTDIDSLSTYVGGSEACITQVLATPDLEALPAKSTDSIAIDSDHLNPPPIKDKRVARQAVSRPSPHPCEASRGPIEPAPVMQHNDLHRHTDADEAAHHHFARQRSDRAPYLVDPGHAAMARVDASHAPSHSRRRRGTNIPEIATALLLTVLLAGIAACGGHSTGNSNQLPAKPAVDSGLRIGIRQLVRQGQQLWLTLRIESADPSQPNIWVLGGGGEFMGLLIEDPVVHDVQMTGIRYNEQNQTGSFLAPIPAHPRTPGPIRRPEPTPNWTGYDLTVPFLITGKPGATISLTIRNIRFEKPNGDLRGKVISGRWAFSFVLPANLPTPTPSPTIPVK